MHFLMVVSEPAGLLGWGPLALSRRPRSRSLPRGRQSPLPSRDGVPGDPAVQSPRGGGNPSSRPSKPSLSHRSSRLLGCVRASIITSLDQGSESEKQNAHFILSMCFQSVRTSLWRASRAPHADGDNGSPRSDQGSCRCGVALSLLPHDPRPRAQPTSGATPTRATAAASPRRRLTKPRAASIAASSHRR